jgi:hypothetical protein
MKPVRQTQLSDHARGVRGNCLRAAIASLLELEIEDVPAFEELSDGAWFPALLDFLRERGYGFDQMDATDEPTGYVIACGDSPRGIYHAVIYRDGRLAHDPHPSGAGLVSVERYWLISPLTS